MSFPSLCIWQANLCRSWPCRDLCLPDVDVVESGIWRPFPEDFGEESTVDMEDISLYSNKGNLEIKHSIWSLDNLKKQIIPYVSNAYVGTGLSGERRRDREVSVLSQVKNMLMNMEDALHHRQIRLGQAMGSLQAGLTVVSSGGAATPTMLDDITDKLKCLYLSVEEESAFISLGSDGANPLKSYCAYSSVDDNDQPLVTAFGNQGNKTADSQSPNQDHDDLLNSGSREFSADVVLAQLSSNVDDWLLKKVPTTETADDNTPAVLPSAAFSHPLASPRNTNAMNSFTSNDLSRWLMKQSVDLKEQHVPDLQTAAAERKLPGRGDQGHAGIFQPLCLDLKDWLFRGPPSLPSTNTIPDESKTWLLQACQQLTSLNDLKHKNHFQNVSKDQSSWLCSQAYRRQRTCQKGQNEAISFSHISKDKDFWLQKQSKIHTADKKEHKLGSAVGRPCGINKSCCRKTPAMEVDEKWLSSSSTVNSQACLVKNICRANELCGSLSECVSKPDCCTLWFQENSSVKNVVDPTQAFKPLSLKLHEWLLPQSQNLTKSSVTAPLGERTNGLSQHNNKNTSMWLMNAAATSQPCPKFKVDKEESNLWCQKIASSNLPELSPSMETVESNSTPSDGSTSGWLLVANEESDKKQEMHEQDMESEGWSICTDCHSFCTDENTKDIAVADEYISKWLM